MSKVRDISNLSNVIRTDASGNVSFVSGSTTLATLNTSGQLSGSSPVLSSSYALNADLLDGLDSTQFTLTSSFAAQTASFTAFTASVNSFTASQLVLNGKYATTGSNTFAGIQTINSNLVVTGSITAQTLVVQTITSSVDFVTGSTQFGTLLSNTHVFSGSVSMNPNGLFVSGSGNVGIGNTNPSFALTIQADTTDMISWKSPSYEVGRLGLDTTNAHGAIFLYSSGSQIIQISAKSGAYTYFNAGNVGIGTSSPAYTLDVSGTGRFTGALTTDYLTANSGALINTTSSPFILFNSSGGGNAKRFALNMTNGDYMKIYSLNDNGTTRTDNILTATIGGNVGIGTSSPSAGLEVVTDSGAFNALRLVSNRAYNLSTDVALTFRYLYDTTNYTSGGLIVVAKDNTTISNQSGNMQFYTNNAGTVAERMRITSAGNVGIGTSSPSYKLDITSTSAAQISLTATDAGGYNEIYFRRNSNTTIGYIGVGVNSTVTLAGDDFVMQSMVVGGNLVFRTNGGSNAQERMRITSGGNVGIGVTPTEKLHIYSSAGPEFRMEGGAFSWYIRAYNDNFNVLTPTGRQAISYLNNGDVRNYNNTTTWQTTSDVRVKENINTIPNALDKIIALNPVTFDYKQEFADKNNWDDNKKINNVGFIAQEFETIFPKYISTNKYEMTETIIDDLKSIDTGHLVAYLVKAIQEQQAQINELKAQING